MKLRYRIAIGLIGTVFLVLFTNLFKIELQESQNFFESSPIRTFYYAGMMVGNTLFTLAVWIGK